MNECLKFREFMNPHTAKGEQTHSVYDYSIYCRFDQFYPLPSDSIRCLLIAFIAISKYLLPHRSIYCGIPCNCLLRCPLLSDRIQIYYFSGRGHDDDDDDEWNDKVSPSGM